MRGSWRAKSAERRNEVQPPALTYLEPPDWLGEDAKAHWQETVPTLAAMGILTALDVHGWTRACSLWGLLRALDRMIDSDGMVLVDNQGVHRINPALKLQQKLTMDYFKLAESYGCSPRGRIGLGVVVTPPNELDTFMKAKKARYFKNDKERFFRRPLKEDA